MILVLQDVGANPNIDDAVLRLVGKGIVSGVSVFATGNNASSMIAKADASGVAVGAHLAINASRHYRLQYTRDHELLGIFEGDPMPVCKDDRMDVKDIRSEFCEQMSIVTDFRGRPPDYFDCHCYHLRDHPEIYGFLLDSFGTIPLIQKDDPYQGAAYRFSGKIQDRTIAGARSLIRKYSKEEKSLVFAHVGEHIIGSWKKSYLALLKKRLPFTRIPWGDWRKPE